MVFISLTRLRLHSIRFLPLFALHAIRSQRQVTAAAGCQSVKLLPDRNWTFWTMTAWDSQESMRAYMTSGSHARAMPHLMHWCDEASVAHWTQPEAALPSWVDADKRMRQTGRPSQVRHPSPQHASLGYKAPRTTGGASL